MSGRLTPFVSDADFQLYVGDVRQVLAGLPAESVHCVVTSPPWRPIDGERHLDPPPPPQHTIPCTVLDPFMGSGTTALVARRLGRNSIGIELNQEYARLCATRTQQLSVFA